MATKTRTARPATRKRTTAKTTARSSGARGAKPKAAASSTTAMSRRLSMLTKQVNFLLARVPEHERTDLT